MIVTLRHQTLHGLGVVGVPEEDTAALEISVLRTIDKGRHGFGGVHLVKGNPFLVFHKTRSPFPLSRGMPVPLSQVLTPQSDFARLDPARRHCGARPGEGRPAPVGQSGHGSWGDW